MSDEAGQPAGRHNTPGDKLNAARVLWELGQRGLIVSRDADGRPYINGDINHPELVAAALRFRWLFVWGLTGAESGLSWHACNVCEAVELLATSRPCGMTIDCAGRMLLVAGVTFQPVPGLSPDDDPRVA